MMKPEFLPIPCHLEEILGTDHADISFPLSNLSSPVVLFGMSKCVPYITRNHHKPSNLISLDLGQTCIAGNIIIPFSD